MCDFYIAMDVICSTSSIFNLVAISIDRYVPQELFISTRFAPHTTPRTKQISYSLSVGMPRFIMCQNVVNMDYDDDNHSLSGWDGY